MASMSMTPPETILRSEDSANILSIEPDTRSAKKFMEPVLTWITWRLTTSAESSPALASRLNPASIFPNSAFVPKSMSMSAPRTHESLAKSSKNSLLFNDGYSTHNWVLPMIRLSRQNHAVSTSFRPLDTLSIDPIRSFDWTHPFLLAYAWLWQPFTLWSP